MTDAEISALDFWRKPINDALQGEPIRAIDTEDIRHSFLIKISVMNCGLKQSGMNLGFKISCKTAKRLWIF